MIRVAAPPPPFRLRWGVGRTPLALCRPGSRAAPVAFFAAARAPKRNCPPHRCPAPLSPRRSSRPGPPRRRPRRAAWSRATTECRSPLARLAAPKGWGGECEKMKQQDSQVPGATWSSVPRTSESECWAITRSKRSTSSVTCEAEARASMVESSLAYVSAYDGGKPEDEASIRGAAAWVAEVKSSSGVSRSLASAEMPPPPARA